MIQIEKIAQLTGHKGSIFATHQHQAEYFISGAGEGWIVQWELANPDPGKLIAKVESNVFSLFQYGRNVIAGDMEGGMHWIDLDRDETIDVQHHRGGIFDIWKAGTMIYALGGDGYISRRPMDDPKAVESMQISHQALRCQVSIGDRMICIGSSDGALYFIDMDDLRVKHKVDNAHDNSVFTLVYDDARDSIWSGGRDAQIKTWSKEGKPLESIAAHMYTVNSLCFNSDKSLLFSGSRDKTIKIWDPTSLKLLKVIEGIRDGGHLNSVNSLLWSPDQNYLISGSDDRSIGIWRIEKTAHDTI